MNKLICSKLLISLCNGPLSPHSRLLNSISLMYCIILKTLVQVHTTKNYVRCKDIELKKHISREQKTMKGAKTFKIWNWIYHEHLVTIMVGFKRYIFIVTK